jgi:hypothetical protein
MLRDKKNKFFSEVLRDLPRLQHRTQQLNQRIIVNKEPWFVFQLGAHKKLERAKEDFNKETIENWPYVTVIINNRPDVQLIAVSRNRNAFSSSKVVIDSFKSAIESPLRRYQLSVHIEALFDEREFWSIVDSYPERITNLRFDLISPNMANISKVLKIDLGQINKETNSHKTVIDLNSPENSSLEINKDNKVINGLVEYASEGGGDISFKIRGMKRRIHTTGSTNTFEIDEMTVENLSADRLETFIDHVMTGK